jgi:hypothetical protein
MAAVLQCFLLSVILVCPLGEAFISEQNGNAGKPQAATSKNVPPDGITKERPFELVSLITSVHWAPPEFAADLLIGIAESA